MSEGQKGIKLKARGSAKREMGSYGRQFELLMTSIGIDLINAYNGADQPGDVAEFVREFFNSEAPGTPPHFPRPSSPEAAVLAKKGKGAKGKGGPKKEMSPPPDEKRCEAKTAKGARCMKCAKDGDVFCSVHLKTAAPSSKAKAKGKEKTKEPVVEPESVDEAESSNSRAAQILHEVNKKAEEPVTSKSLKSARPSKKKKVEDEPIPPPPPLARAEAVKPSWFDEGEEEFDEDDGAGADDDPSWEAGTE